MKAEWKTKWLAALRGGEYKQTTGVLRSSKSDCFCCLGVLADIQGCPYDDLVDLHMDTTPDGYGAGLPVRKEMELANMNDCGMSFAEIADHIEKTVPAE